MRSVTFDGQDSHPVMRTEDLDTGVNCMTCHGDDDDIIHGPFGAESTGHSTVKDPVFSENNAQSLCAACHPEMVYVDTDKRCIDCHMPEVVRAHASDPLRAQEVPKRRGRRHTFHGAHNRNMVARALTVKVERSGVVSIQNTGAGHAIPTYRRATIFIEAGAFDRSGMVLERRQMEIRRDQQLMPGKTWTGQAPLPEGTATIQVTFKYQPTYDRPTDRILIGSYTQAVKND